MSALRAYTSAAIHNWYMYSIYFNKNDLFKESADIVLKFYLINFAK